LKKSKYFLIGALSFLEHIGRDEWHVDTSRKYICKE